MALRVDSFHLALTLTIQSLLTAIHLIAPKKKVLFFSWLYFSLSMVYEEDAVTQVPA